MHRIIILISAIILSLSAFSAPAEDAASALRELDNIVKQRDSYYARHEAQIDSVKRELNALQPTDYNRRAALLSDIFTRYRSFQGDSAAAVAERELDLARKSGNPDRIILAECDRLFSFISKGNYTDAVLLVRSLDLKGVSPTVRGEFYYLCNRLYSDINRYNSGDAHNTNMRLSAAYADSVVATMPPGSYKATYSSLFRTLDNKSTKEKIQIFSNLYNRPDIDNSERAMISSVLGDLYYADNQKDKAVVYKTRASIMDITEGKRETLAMQKLADWMFQNGDYDRASRYINAALDDANFFNAPHRKSQIANMLPLIESIRYNKVDKERRTLWFTMSILVILLLALGAAVFLNIRARRKLAANARELARQQEELKQANAQLAEANKRSESANAELQVMLERYKDSVKIKDEYIGHFFFANSEYIDKMEQLYNTVRKKLLAHQYDDLLQSLSDRDVRKEQAKMLHEFDTMFLRLFPGYIPQYAALFPEEEETPATPLVEKTLTPEMRIFALIRLGITDTARIANFLNYSIHTVNTYKTRAKNRSHLPNDRFEEAIQQIR